MGFVEVDRGSDGWLCKTKPVEEGSEKVALSVWTVAELGAFYTEHRSELLSHANRVLRY